MQNEKTMNIVISEIKNGIDATDPLSIECQAQILDLSKKGLKKVPKQDDAQNVKILILDDNDLQKIDNIDSYLRIEKVMSYAFSTCPLVYTYTYINFIVFNLSNSYHYVEIIYFVCTVFAAFTFCKNSICLTTAY